MNSNDGMGDLGRGRGQYMTTAGHGPIIVQRGGRDIAPAEWWVEQPLASEDVSQFNLLEYWRIIVKHRVWAISIFVACLAIAMVANLMMTPIYTASTTIQIDREPAKVVDVEGMTPEEGGSADEFLQTQYGLLKSQSLAERVVDNLGLAKDGTFIKAMGATPKAGTTPEDVKIRRKQAVGLVAANRGVRPVRGSRLVAVSFDSPSPGLSATVANALATAFIETNLERRYDSASYARDFLESRLKQVKARLEDSERQLVAYAAKEQIVNVAVPTEGGGAEQTASQSLTASDLVAMNSALAAARAQRIQAEQRWRQASAGDGSSIPEVLQSPTIQAMRQQKATLQAQYQDKLNVYKPDFPAMVQLKAQIDELDRQIKAEIGAVRQSIRGQYQIAAREEASLAGNVNSLKSGVMDLRNRSIQYTILQREVDTNRTLYDGLLQRYKEIGVAGGVGNNNVSVVDAATPPGSPTRPKPLLNLAVAALLGMVLGVLAALLVELLDESIQTPEDIETKLGLTLLGAIPVPQKGMSLEQALADPRSAVSEAYYSVRTALQFSTPTGVPEVLLVTSSRAAEGKSTTSRIIAQNFARLGMRVLLIDADLRNPSLHRMLGRDNSRGLTNLLTSGERVGDVVQPTGEPNLSFIPCGPLPPNPAELLGSEQLRVVLTEASTLFDLVLLDGPPILGLADAPILTNAASGVLLVVAAHETKRGPARAALRRLKQGAASGKILGAVLTKLDLKRTAYSYGYSYDYDYGGAPTQLIRG